MADVTSTRNWCTTGVVVYCGTILASGVPASMQTLLPVLPVVILGALYTVYERGNAERMKDYCTEADKWLQRPDSEIADGGLSILPLESWLQSRSGSKLAYYWSVLWRKKSYWLPLVLFLTAIALATFWASHLTRYASACR